MVNWLFNKPGATRAAPAAPQAARSAPVKTGPTPQQKAEAKAEAKAKQLEEARTQWAPRFQAALGDDAALLRVAVDAPVVEIKLAAVEALAGEDALKQAERELRNSDRRVHRAAKQRLDGALKQRESRAHAATLLDAARALAHESPIPANRLVALDRGWQALDAAILEPNQVQEFAELRERLNATLHAHGELERALQQWLALAKPVLAELQRGCGLPGAEGDALILAQAATTAQALHESRSDLPVTAVLGQALAAALASAQQVLARWAEPPPVVAEVAAAPAAPVPVVAAHAPRTLNAQQRESLGAWLLQAETALAEGQLAAMQQHLDSADRLVESVHGARIGDALHGRLSALHAESSRLKGWQQWGGSRARDDLVVEAEALARITLASAGRPVAPPQSPLVAQSPQAAHARSTAHGAAEPMDPQTAAGAPAPAMEESTAPLAAPPEAEDAVAPAGGEASAQIIDGQSAEPAAAQVVADAAHVADTADAADAAAASAAPAQSPQRGAPAREPKPRKLNLKAHADTIADLRKRWKELDRLGAPANQSLWKRFDAALHVAHEPVLAHLAVLKAQREANLAARDALLAELDAVPAEAASQDGDALVAHWKQLTHALDQFQRAWRPLGPLEHTVPSAARQALQQRLRAGVERIETPLQEARKAAEGVREQLIERALALVEEAKLQPQLRDAIPRVRELQIQWQQSARSMTLQRNVESALWNRFKAATDAVFTQRDAAANARDTELAANLAAREALLQRLEGLSSATPSAEIERTLAEVDRAWRIAGEPPRGTLPRLEARLHDAHGAALRALSASGQVAWAAACDRLAAQLSLCEEREAAATIAADSLAQRWAAQQSLPVTLPAAWEQALAQRWSQAADAPVPASFKLEDLLLQLESTLDLPASPQQIAARRALKLRALKDTLEGRGAAAVDASDRASWLSAALRHRSGDAGLRERLHALIAALRAAAPGTLAPAAARR